jgi:capsule polysaccharide export protein KpsE/RkpR
MADLNQQQLDGLRAQLAMALSSNEPSKMQIAMLRAQIEKLESQIKDEYGNE